MSKSLVPQIRFKGFTAPWEQYKLGDCSEYTIGGGTPDTSNTQFWKGVIPWIQSSDLTEGSCFQVSIRKYISQKAIAASATRLVPKNSLSIITRVGVGKLALLPFDYCTSQDFLSFVSLKIDKKFSVYAIGLILNDIKKSLQGTSIKGITKNEIISSKIIIPKVSEQNKIGSTLFRIDSLITLHQRKCDLLKNLKKSLLEKLFPKNNKSTPEIRFKGFTDAWEQRCFSDIAEVRRGLTYTPDHLTNTKINSIRVLRSSNIFDGSFICSDKDDVFVTKNIVRIKTIKNGEILVTAANGSSALVGKHCIVQGVSDGSAVHGGFMLAVKTSFPGFLQASMNSEWYEKFIKIYSSGGNGSIGNLSGSVLLKQEIPIPEEHEIKQIGVFFEKIDSLITLHQR